MIGTGVRLKPERARAYGFDPSERYRVVAVETKKGYKTPWLHLEGGSMLAPYNVVKSTEVIRIEGGFYG